MVDHSVEKMKKEDSMLETNNFGSFVGASREYPDPSSPKKKQLFSKFSDL